MFGREKSDEKLDIRISGYIDKMIRELRKELLNEIKKTVSYEVQQNMRSTNNDKNTNHELVKMDKKSMDIICVNIKKEIDKTIIPQINELKGIVKEIMLDNDQIMNDQFRDLYFDGSDKNSHTLL